MTVYRAVKIEYKLWTRMLTKGWSGRCVQGLPSDAKMIYSWREETGGTHECPSLIFVFHSRQWPKWPLADEHVTSPEGQQVPIFDVSYRDVGDEEEGIYDFDTRNW